MQFLLSIFDRFFNVVKCARIAIEHTIEPFYRCIHAIDVHFSSATQIQRIAIVSERWRENQIIKLTAIDCSKVIKISSCAPFVMVASHHAFASCKMIFFVESQLIEFRNQWILCVSHRMRNYWLRNRVQINIKTNVKWKSTICLIYGRLIGRSAFRFILILVANANKTINFFVNFSVSVGESKAIFIANWLSVNFNFHRLKVNIVIIS